MALIFLFKLCNIIQLIQPEMKHWVTDKDKQESGMNGDKSFSRFNKVSFASRGVRVTFS